MRLFEEARPELVFHLAAEVGGIGANRANPGRYWYANLLMGVARARAEPAARRREARHRSARSARTRSSRRCRSARTTSGTAIPEETNAPYGVAKKSLLVGGADLPRAVRAERDLPAAGEPLRAARQLRPRDLARDPGADPQDGRGRRARRARDRALGRRLADARVPLRRGLRRRDPARGGRATTAPSRSTSAPAPRSRSASSPS